MKDRQCNVAVKQLPKTFSDKQGKLFFIELESCLNVDRPRIVLDCSRVDLMDKSTLNLLLRCLEESMKRNGDVKLAAIPAEAKAALELTGAHSLFEIFETNTDAVKSYRRRMADAASDVREPDNTLLAPENATSTL